jgi:hypothetical protein
MNISTFRCPVCGYLGLKEPPYDSYGYGSCEICNCCGFEFGYDDGGFGGDRATKSEAYRERWLARGAPWFSLVGAKPKGWSLRVQLETIGIDYDRADSPSSN